MALKKKKWKEEEVKYILPQNTYSVVEKTKKKTTPKHIMIETVSRPYEKTLCQ